jgi:hypothetical protein
MLAILEKYQVQIERITKCCNKFLVALESHKKGGKWDDKLDTPERKVR